MAKLCSKRQEVVAHLLSSVSLERTKEQIRIYDDEEDLTLQAYIEAATCTLERWTGYDLLSADYIAYFNTCPICRPGYILSGRPLNSITKVEVYQVEAADYVEVTSDDYTVSEETWETIVCISNDIEIDSTFVDPVRISYQTGKERTVNVTTITSSAQVATCTVDDPHGLKTNDQVIIGNSGIDQFNGIFTVTVTDANIFTFTFTGTPSGAASAGLATIPEIPPQLELAVMQMVAGMYGNRGDCSDSCGDVPCGSQALAKSYRRYDVMSAGAAYDCCCW